MRTMYGTGLVAVRRPLPRRGGRLLLAMVLAVALAAGASARSAPAAAAVSAPGVLGWGGNWSGQLGDGTTDNSDVPVFADLPADVTPIAVATGLNYSLALDSTGQVWGWGDNWCGNFGNGTTDSSLTPVRGAMPAGVKLTAIDAAWSFALGLTSDGQVLAWGCNFNGQLGDGTFTDSAVPVHVDLPPGVKVDAIANYGGNATALALTSDGRVLAWGAGSQGQLGNGCDLSVSGGCGNSNKPEFVKLPPGVKVTEISGKQFYSMALTSTGQVFTWGWNDRGQLGNGTTTPSSVPVLVHLPAGVTATKITAGRQFGLALTSSGELLAWGENERGQLGIGTSTGPNDCGDPPFWSASCSLTPVPVDLPPGVSVTALAAAGEHALALKSTGQVLAWGGNQDGQLGIGTDTGPEMCNGWSCSTTPVSVHLPDGVAVTAIVATAQHSIALARGVPTLTLSKALSGSRVNARDQFTVQIKDSTGDVLTQSTTAGSGSTITQGTGTTEFTATPGTEYFLTEAGADLGDYTHTITCTDESGL